VHDLAGRGHERESRIDELLGMVALAPRFAGFYPTNFLADRLSGWQLRGH